MNFISLHLKEGFSEKTIEFGKRTLLHSKDNTQGKTTAIRLLIYSLGYNIRGVGDFNFDYRVETSLLLEVKNILYRIDRVHNRLMVTNMEEDLKFSFVVPTQLIEVHTLIFGDLGQKFFDSLLGSCYVDQTQGSVTLNRGKIIGGINFNVDELILSLDDKNVASIQNEIEIESKKLKEYKGLYNIAKYIDDNNLENEDLYIENKDIDVEIYAIKNEIKKLKEELKSVDASLNKNISFVETIENFKLYVKYNDEEIPVNKNTIRGFTDNKSLLKARKDVLSSNIKSLQSKLSTLRVIPQEIFPDFESYKDMINQQLSNLNLDQKTADKLIKSTQSKLRVLRNQKNEIIEHNSDVIQFMNSKLKNISESFNLNIDKSGIRTHNVQNKSGANFFQIIIAYKIVYLLSIYEFTKIRLPFIIDSLRTSEVTEKNADEILTMIEQYLPEHQIIIASVYRYRDYFIDKEVEIEYPLINEGI